MGKDITNIYNSTNETIKICLLDTKSNTTDEIISAGETWGRKTNYAWNTVGILLLNFDQNTFSYTLASNMSLVIKRKLGQLILLPFDKSLKYEMDVTLESHRCWDRTKGVDAFCYWTGCIVFNESNEPIKVCVTDYNQRNTHII
ncbi:unnamed protein product [Rotaria sp. Silwood2]|nr:unnamed protein product [Rotaria sp. Silwood2]